MRIKLLTPRRCLLTIFAGMMHRPEFRDYFWPGFIIWGLDRSMRVGRLAFFNRHKARGTVELVSEDTVRLTLARPMRWRAGQHAYVVLPSVSTAPFEAHPFTISSIVPENKTDGKLVFYIRSRGGFTKRLREHAKINGHGDIAALVDGPYGMPPDLDLVRRHSKWKTTAFTEIYRSFRQSSSWQVRAQFAPISTLILYQEDRVSLTPFPSF